MFHYLAEPTKILTMANGGSKPVPKIEGTNSPLFFEEMDVYLLSSATMKKRGLFFQLLIDGTHQTTIHLNHSICNALKDRNWQRGCRGCLKQYYPISHKI